MVTIDGIEYPEPVCIDDKPHPRHRIIGTWRTDCPGRHAPELQPAAAEAPARTGTGAMEELMELIHAAAAPVIERRQMTDDQAVTYMTLLFDRLIVTTIAERPDTAERLLTALAADLAEQDSAEPLAVAQDQQ